MKVITRFVQGHHFIGSDEKNVQTHFDSRSDGFPAGTTPVAAILQAMAACSAIDVVDILNKKRKTVTNLVIETDGERAEEHPRVFTKALLHFKLTSPDADIKDLERSIELSQDKYCSVSAMFSRSGCTLSWSAEVVRE
ncbi:MAG: OsmC family protein [Candidatus Kapabacteria bacterium]|nr:OsmC family protein [Candidatus Kapabacteria bacterium]